MTDNNEAICFCGHSEGSHVDNIVAGTWTDYCLGCDDSEDDDDVMPSHNFSIVS